MLSVRRILIVAMLCAYLIEHIECQTAPSCSVPILYHPSRDESKNSDFGNCAETVDGRFNEISANISYSSLSKSSNSKSLELDFLEAFRDQSNRTECLDFLLGYRASLKYRDAILNVTVTCGGKVKLQFEGFFFKPDPAVTVSFEGGRYYLPDNCFPLAGYRMELDLENERLRFERNVSSELASLELEGGKVVAAQSLNYKSCNCSRLGAYLRALMSCKEDQLSKKAEKGYKKKNQIHLKSNEQLVVTITLSGVAISVVLFVVYYKFIKFID